MALFPLFLSTDKAHAAEGLTAEVYDIYEQSSSPSIPQGNSPIITTNVPSINFEWGSGSVLGGPSERVIVRFSGYILSNTTQEISFMASADDGTMLYIDGSLVTNDWYDKGSGGSTSAPISFTAGVPKTIVLMYYENGGGANVFLYWDQSGSMDIVPASAFTSQAAPIVKTIGAPRNLTVTDNGSQAVLTWESPNTGNTQPERYAISFSADSGGWGIATGNVGDSNALNTTINVSYQILESLKPSGTTWTFSIRSDNDTNSLYSDISNEVSIKIGKTPEEKALIKAEEDAELARLAEIERLTEVARLAEIARVEAEAAAKLLSEQEAARLAEEQELARLAAIKAEQDRISAELAAQKAEADRLLAEEAAKAQEEKNRLAAIAAAKAEADRLLAEAAALKAEQDRIAAELAAKRAEEEARVAEELRLKAEQEAKLAEEERLRAEEEARIQAEIDAQAEADRIKAEAEAAEKAEADRILEEQRAKDEADRIAQEEANAKAEAEAIAKEEADRLAEEERIAQEKADQEAEAKAAKAEEDARIAEEQKLKEAAEEGKLTEEQKDVVADKLIEQALSSGQAITAQQIQQSGIEYKDLPPTTPVDIRTDENGNAVVITAEVAAQVELLQDPGALLETAFSDPGAALEALGSIGADMSDEEREEATDMVVATVVAAGAAINAAGVAAAGSTSSTGGSGGGSSGGGSGSNSPGSRGGRRW